MKSKYLIEKRLFKGYPQHELNYIDLRVKDIIGLMEEYANQQWISVNDRLPDELEEYPHREKLWLNVPPYGSMEGFFKGGKFWKNYASQIIGVTHWMPLPEPPEK